jgi:DNA-directed RNA polymerase specialized sigma24 family protein
MSAPAPKWAIDAAALQRLLDFLDPDRDAAARKYEDIRRRLLKLFTWRGCTSPEDCADRAIDRVARRLVEGVDIHTRDPYHYFQGVALNVLREHVREPARRWESLAPGRQLLAAAPDDPLDAAHTERRFACLDECLGALTTPHRMLLLDYHGGDRHIEHRQSLAASLGIAPNALRIRVHRLRNTLQSCVTRCLSATTGSEIQPPVPH